MFDNDKYYLILTLIIPQPKKKTELLHFDVVSIIGLYYSRTYGW